MNIKGNFIGRFQKRVLETIKTHGLARKGEKLVVGVSGGPDSTCLLHVLHSLAGELGVEIHAVHVNHLLRAEEAEADEAYTAGLCREMGVPVHVVRVDVAAMARERGISLEEAGRAARYDEFAKYAESVGASKIAVAHNKNDQAETVMMNIIRGTGAAGLAGMDYLRNGIVRPLLDISREEIEQYCREAGLEPRTDSSNLRGDYTRNKVRLGLFPYIDGNFGSNIVESLCRLSKNTAVDSRYLEKCSLEAYERILEKRRKGLVGLNAGRLRELDPALLGRVLKAAICEAAGNCSGISGVHYDMLAGLVAKGKTGMSAELPGGMRAVMSYGVLEFYSPEEWKKTGYGRERIMFSHRLEIPGRTFVPILGSTVATSVISAEDVDKPELMGYNPLVRYFDYGKLKEGINIRNRRNGDVFKPRRSRVTKKLKKYFIDRKVPRGERDMIPLICKDNEVVWIIGHEASDKFGLTENTKSVLRIEYIGGVQHDGGHRGSAGEPGRNRQNGQKARTEDI